MGVEIGDGVMTSSASDHTAHQTPEGSWEVSWLPGRVLDRDRAASGMLLADTVASGLSLDDQRWPALDAWARELGLSGPEAVVRASTTDEVRAQIARFEAAEAAAKADAVPMTGPVEESEAGEAWSRRVDDAVHGFDATNPEALDAWMQDHAESETPHLREAELVAAWESRDAAEPTGASADRQLDDHARSAGAAPPEQTANDAAELGS